MAWLKLKVEDFEWDEDNMAECAYHGLGPRIVAEVRDRQPLFFLNDPERTATHMMVGPDYSGRTLVVAILETAVPGRWRPITGYPAEKKHMDLYEKEFRRVTKIR